MENVYSVTLRCHRGISRSDFYFSSKKNITLTPKNNYNITIVFHTSELQSATFEVSFVILKTLIIFLSPSDN